MALIDVPAQRFAAPIFEFAEPMIRNAARPFCADPIVRIATLCDDLHVANCAVLSYHPGEFTTNNR